MVKQNKERIMITLPKKQLNGLKRAAEAQGKLLSKLISEILSNKVCTISLQIDQWKKVSDDDIMAIIGYKWMD